MLSVLPLALPTWRENFLPLFLLALALPFFSNAEWSLTWSDEFNGFELNSSIWDIEILPPRANNDELQAYTSDSIIVGNGHLVLLAQQRNYTSPQGWKANYTSGRINSTLSLLYLLRRPSVSFTFFHSSREEDSEVR